MKKEVFYYELRDEKSGWLGSIILKPSGQFFSITDYGNFSMGFGSFGSKDFREFILSLDVQYFGGKIYQHANYVVSSREMQRVCTNYSEKILPVLKQAIKEELELEKNELPSPLETLTGAFAPH